MSGFKQRGMDSVGATMVGANNDESEKAEKVKEGNRTMHVWSPPTVQL